MTKELLRDKMIQLRKLQSQREKKIKDQSIVNQIKKHNEFLKSKTVALFYPMTNEIDLRELLEEHKTFLFPRVRKNELDFYIYHNQMKWEISKFGVKEPARSEQLFKGESDRYLW